MRRLLLVLSIAIILALAAWSTILYHLGSARYADMPFDDIDMAGGNARGVTADGVAPVVSANLRAALGEMSAILEGDEPADLAKIERLAGMFADVERGASVADGERKIARACRMTAWLWEKALSEGVTNRADWPRLWLPSGTMAKKSAFILHGFSASPRQLANQAAFLSARGYNVFTMRFSCHGGDSRLLDSGRFRAWLRDGEIACEIARLIGDEVYGFGNLMGGVVVLHVSTRAPLAGVALGAPALYLKNRVAETPVLDALAALSRIPGLRRFLSGVYFTDEFGYHTVPQPYGAILEQRKLARFVRHELKSVSCPLFASWNVDDDVVDPVRSSALLRSLVGPYPAAFREYAGNDHTLWDVAPWLLDGHPNLREQKERMLRYFDDSVEFISR